MKHLYLHFSLLGIFFHVIPACQKHTDLVKGGPKARWWSWTFENKGVTLKVLTKIVDLSASSFLQSVYILSNVPLSLIMLFTLKSALVAVAVATAAFFWLMVAWYTFSTPLLSFTPCCLFAGRRGLVSNGSKQGGAQVGMFLFSLKPWPLKFWPSG